MAKSGQVPNIDLAALKSGGKSIDELTGIFCNHQIQQQIFISCPKELNPYGIVAVSQVQSLVARQHLTRNSGDLGSYTGLLCYSFLHFCAGPRT